MKLSNTANQRFSELTAELEHIFFRTHDKHWRCERNQEDQICKTVNIEFRKKSVEKSQNVQETNEAEF